MLRRLPLAIASLLLAIAGGSCSTAPLRAAESGVAARPVILLVHGRGHAARDSAEVRRSAQAALARGIQGYGVAPGEMLRDGDVRVVWYADVAGDLATVDGAVACGREDGYAPGVGSDMSIVAGFVGALLDVVGDVGNAPELRNFRDDVRFIADRRVQCASERRLHAALVRAASERRPVVVVAHSMGALVSWGYLQHRERVHPDTIPSIASFVTLGSPLGSADIRAMVFGDGPSTLRMPAGVRQWVNVVDADDPFAAAVAGTGASRRAPGGPVDRWTTSTRDDPHGLEGYLRDPAGAAAVLGGWCSAIARVPASMESACAAAVASE